MEEFASAINYYLEMFRSGKSDDAFHGLLEIDVAILPELIQAFRDETNPRAQEFLLEVIWEYREPSVIPFLGEILLHPNPPLRLQALNGLVTLASPASLQVLMELKSRFVHSDKENREFLAKLEEAANQIRTEIQG